MSLHWRQPFIWLQKRSWWVKGLMIVAVIGVVAGGWWWTRRSQPEAVTTIQPEVQTLEKTLEFTGMVEAERRATMKFSVGGQLIYLGAQEGEAVTKGQTIASLDQRSVQKNLQKKLAVYESQRYTFENAEDTRTDRWLDTEEAREAAIDQNTLDQAVLDVELQSLVVQDYRLSAPFSGILIKSPVKVTGVNVAATDSFEVVDPDSLVFEVAVDEVDIDEVFVGQKATVYLDARPQEPVAATVMKVGLRSVQGSSGTVFPVTLQFMDPVTIEAFRLGMNGEAQLVVGRRENVLSVPIATLISRDDKTVVRIKTEEGTVEDREVEVGLETEDRAEILSGLTSQDQVVLP